MDGGTSSSLSKLVTEFSNELALVGAKVDAIEARTISNERRIDSLEEGVNSAPGSKIKFDGQLGFRWEALFNDGLSDRQWSDPQVRFQLDMGGQTSDKIKWGASLLTTQDTAPAQSWRNFGTDAIGANGAAGFNSPFGGAELRLHKYWVKYIATDQFKIKIGKQKNSFANTELIFDEDIAPTGITQKYKIDDRWTVKAGQYFIKDGTNAAGVAQNKEDVYLFAHSVSYKHEGFGGKWVAKAANFNFTGEQFVHRGQNLGTGYFNRVATANGQAFETVNMARSGNYYNVSADGSLNNQGNAAHNLNNTTTFKQLQLLSDFNLFNAYLGYEDDSDATDPWGVKLDYVINNSAWNSEDTGWWFEIYRGKLAKKGDVEYGYQYKRVETDAVLSWLNEDQLQTNVKGSSVYFKTRVQQNMDWFTTYFLFEPVTGNSVDKQGVLRTGLTLRF